MLVILPVFWSECFPDEEDDLQDNKEEQRISAVAQHSLQQPPPSPKKEIPPVSAIEEDTDFNIMMALIQLGVFKGLSSLFSTR
jgi:hypothetical protein